MPFLDAVRLAPKRAPVKCSPVTVLQVYKDCQNTEDHHAGQNALLVHEGGNSAPRSRDARWETATPRYPTQPARSNLSPRGPCGNARCFRPDDCGRKKIVPEGTLE